MRVFFPTHRLMFLSKEQPCSDFLVLPLGHIPNAGALSATVRAKSTRVRCAALLLKSDSVNTSIVASSTKLTRTRRHPDGKRHKVKGKISVDLSCRLKERTNLHLTKRRFVQREREAGPNWSFLCDDSFCKKIDETLCLGC